MRETFLTSAARNYMYIESLEGLIHTAWGIIANAYGGDWEMASKEWSDAAIRWRDEMHEMIESGDDKCE